MKIRASRWLTAGLIVALAALALAALHLHDSPAPDCVLCHAFGHGCEETQSGSTEPPSFQSAGAVRFPTIASVRNASIEFLEIRGPPAASFF